MGLTKRVRLTDGPARNAADSTAPLVVSRVEGQRLVIAAACPRAVALGLHPGMALAQAQAMLPGLRVIPETPQSARDDREALAALAAWCLRYTPSTRAVPPDGIWLDLTGCAHLHGGEAALLSELASFLSHAGLSARIGLADTPGAAHALAHFATGALSIAAPGDREALLALPVEALRLEAGAAALLHRFGLRRVGELAALPRAPLARRLGAAVALRLDQALGGVFEPIVPALPQTPVAERMDFAEPLLTAESLSGATGLLAARLCHRLQAQCLGARRLELRLHRVDGSRQTQRIALARASYSPRHIARLFDERLEQIDPGDGVEAMDLTAGVAEPLLAEQDRFRSVSMSEDPELTGLATLIDRLGNRLGMDRLWRPAPVQSDVPERSVARAAPLARSADVLEAWPRDLPRPVRLFDPPVPVRTMTTLPDSPPSFFIWRNHRHIVRAADGPERIAGEWWRRPGELSAVRDYFRLEDETGRRFWLYRRGDGEHAATGDLRWFLHGLL